MSQEAAQEVLQLQSSQREGSTPENAVMRVRPRRSELQRAAAISQACTSLGHLAKELKLVIPCKMLVLITLPTIRLRPCVVSLRTTGMGINGCTQPRPMLLLRMLSEEANEYDHNYSKVWQPQGALNMSVKVKLGLELVIT